MSSPLAQRRYADQANLPEQELPRGDVTEGVVRIGDTVRRPHQSCSLAVAAYLDHLESAGFDAAPRYLGRDGQGRDVLTFLSGDVAGDPPDPWAADEDLLLSVGALVRRLHTASAGYGAAQGFAAPPGSSWARDQVVFTAPGAQPEPELISHNDVTPQNVVVVGGTAAGLIDFDLAGPTTRLDDWCATATHWVPLRAPADVFPTWPGIDQARRLRLLADGYGLSAAERDRVLDVLLARAAASWLRMRAAADQLGGGWARMWREGVGDSIRRREAWLLEHRAELDAALRLG